jgi:hypothetical protein
VYSLLHIFSKRIDIEENNSLNTSKNIAFSILINYFKGYEISLLPAASFKKLHPRRTATVFFIPYKSQTK